MAATVAAIQQAVERAGLDDFVIVDCSLDRPQDMEHCISIVRQAAVPVHIIYADAAHLARLRARLRGVSVRAPLTWLPADVGCMTLIGALRDLRARTLKDRIQKRQRSLSPHQERIWELVAADLSHTKIAHEVGSKPGTVKTDIKRIKAKLGVTNAEDLKIGFRWRAEP